MPYSAGRMLASKIACSGRNSGGRIYPSLVLEPGKRSIMAGKVKTPESLCQ